MKPGSELIFGSKTKIQHVAEPIAISIQQDHNFDPLTEISNTWTHKPALVCTFH